MKNYAWIVEIFERGSWWPIYYTATHCRSSAREYAKGFRAEREKTRIRKYVRAE